MADAFSNLISDLRFVIERGRRLQRECDRGAEQADEIVNKLERWPDSPGRRDQDCKNLLWDLRRLSDEYRLKGCGAGRRVCDDAEWIIVQLYGWLDRNKERPLPTKPVTVLVELLQ